VKKFFGNASKNEIAELEQKYNLQLPKEYKRFLETCNGGISEEEWNIYLEVPDVTTGVLCLYGINTGEDNEISEEMDEYGDDLPPNSLFIGHTMEGCFLILIMDGDDSGVWCWDSSRMFPYSTVEENTYFVADTFTEFAEKYIGWKP
jgi:hypothetical protein